MVDFGYDISDYKAVDPTFGSISSFDNLRKKTKDKGEW
jgi:glycosidase